MTMVHSFLLIIRVLNKDAAIVSTFHQALDIKFKSVIFNIFLFFFQFFFFLLFSHFDFSFGLKADEIFFFSFPESDPIIHPLPLWPFGLRLKLEFW